MTGDLAGPDDRPADDTTPDENVVVRRRVRADPNRDDRPVLPPTTRDDTDVGWGERPSDSDTWLQDQRPPHWD